MALDTRSVASDPRSVEEIIRAAEKMRSEHIREMIRSFAQNLRSLRSKALRPAH